MNTEPPQMGFIPIRPEDYVKETPLKTGKLPQIFRRLTALGFTQRSDEGYVNSNAEANIQTITWGHDKIEDGCAWLMVTARKPFAYITEASKRFAQRRQPELTRRLQLTKEYWLRTTQPHIEDRALRGVELYVATDAYSRLRKAHGNAELWNQTADGKRAPVPAEAFPNWSRDEFREPEELSRDEKLTPELLAAIAAPMMQGRTVGLTLLAIVGVAHDLLRAAQQYVNALPEQKRGIDHIVDGLHKAFNTVTFAEIEASNKGNSRQVPLLPPEGRKQEAETDPKQKAKPERKLQAGAAVAARGAETRSRD